ncbi:hypothetical protein QBC33DRAFT_475596, partial [Phialemonium atrogriseum]
MIIYTPFLLGDVFVETNRKPRFATLCILFLIIPLLIPCAGLLASLDRSRTCPHRLRGGQPTASF